MPFTGSEGKQISQTKAKRLIRSYQTRNPFKARSAPVECVFYGKNVLLKLLRQRNCVGIKFHFAVEAKKQPTLVLVGVTKKGESISKMYINDGPLCPPYCS